ncbi:MAG: hypothetical protein AB7N61_23505 [Acidimicrobiia bacterium]
MNQQMETTWRVIRKLASGLGIVALTVAAFALVNDGTRSDVDAALIVFGIGTAIIVVGLIARALSASEHRPSESALVSELDRLSRLRGSGSLTDQEFSEAKRQVLRGR